MRSASEADAPPVCERDRADFLADGIAGRRCANPDGHGPARVDEALRRRIRAMRAAGWSFWQIGKLLDQEGIHCVRGGRRWHTGTLRQLVAEPRTNAVNRKRA